MNPQDIFLLPKAFKPYSTQLLLFLLFSDYQEVWISQERLKDMLGFSTRTVMRCTAQLEKLGIVSVKRFPGGSKVNHYRLNENRLSEVIEEIGVSFSFSSVPLQVPPEAPQGSAEPGSLDQVLSSESPDEGTPDAGVISSETGGCAAPDIESSDFDPDGKLAALDEKIITGQVNAELLSWLERKSLVRVKTSTLGMKRLLPGKGLDFDRLRLLDIVSFSKLIGWYEESAKDEQDRFARLALEARNIIPETVNKLLR